MPSPYPILAYPRRIHIQPMWRLPEGEEVDFCVDGARIRHYLAQCGVILIDQVFLFEENDGSG
jgi:hypothetical protein